MILGLICWNLSKTPETPKSGEVELQTAPIEAVAAIAKIREKIRILRQRYFSQKFRQINVFTIWTSNRKFILRVVLQVLQVEKSPKQGVKITEIYSHTYFAKFRESNGFFLNKAITK